MQKGKTPDEHLTQNPLVPFAPNSQFKATAPAAAEVGKPGAHKGKKIILAYEHGLPDKVQPKALDVGIT